MKHFMIYTGLLLILLGIGTPALAKTMYVGDIIQITLRREPGIKNKILAMLESGQKVTVLGEQGEWTYVRIDGDKSGWVLTRFLTDKVPSDLQLQALQEKYDKFMEKTKTLRTDNETLETENRNLKTQVGQLQQSLDNTTTAYEKLKVDCRDYLKLKGEYDSVSAELERQRERADVMASRVSKLDFTYHLFMYLAGAGTFFFALLIGGAIRNRNRNRL